MASPKHPENFVSYRGSTVSLSSVVTDLDRVQTALDLSTTAVDRANLRSQATLLRIQAAVTEGDAYFDKRHFDHALSSYQDAGKLILTLIDPQMGSKRSPRTWLDTPAITKALQQVSGGLLGNLVPAALAVPPVALAKPIALSYQELGADPQTTLDAVEDVTADALALADVARTAVEQGRWAEADSLYQQALAKVPGTTPAEREARASLLVNLGAVQTQRSQPDAAITRLGEAEALFRGLNDDLGAAQALHNAALAHLRAGRAKEATESLTKARALAGTASLRGLLAQGTAPAAPAPSRPTIPTGAIGFLPGGIGGTIMSPGLTRPISGVTSRPALSTAGVLTPSLTRPAATVAPVGERIDLLASQLGTDDLQLKFRSLRNASESESLRIESPSQSKLQDFKRQLTVAAGDGMVTLAWDRQAGPAAQLTTLWAQGHMAAKDPKRVGYRPDTLANFATTLPHLYHFVLPIKMGDCHYEIGEYQDAQTQFRRAAAYPSINRPLEAPDLWRRIAENVLAWGDSLYKNDLAQDALPIYRLLVLETDTAPASFPYTDASLSPTGTAVKAWLAAVAANQPQPVLNPAIADVLQRARLRLQYMQAGLDFFGNPTNLIPPFTFRYLQEVARFFANQAQQAEQRYIEFFDRDQNGMMTRTELENAREQAGKEVDAAREREKEAKAMLDGARHSASLADLRAQNALNALNDFNSTAYEARRLAGLVARGNAWTGDDLPNLNYGAAGQTYEGSKHEVLQKMTQRQTEISQELQRTQMENTAQELAAAKVVAQDQQKAAEARQRGAQIGVEIAQLRQAHASEMLDQFNSRVFDPEQWWRMAMFMKGLASTALHRAIETAKLMQQAYNFEQLESRQVIRSTYAPGFTNGLLGAALLASDIESFTHHQITTIRNKPIPVKWVLSLAEQFPGAFEMQLKTTGRMDFNVSIPQVVADHPGTYRHQLAAVEIEVDGFLPFGGLHGRLINSGIGRFRDAAGGSQVRLQGVDTLVLSPFGRRQDGMILVSRQEMRELFEGNSVASGWSLEVPRASNDLDYRGIFDIRLVMYFECLFDRTLFQQDSKPPAGAALQRSRALHLRYAYPDAYFQFRESGRATLQIDERMFPFNQRDPRLRALALAFVPDNGTPLTGAKVRLTHPGAPQPIPRTIGAGNAVPRSDLPVAAGASALGAYTIALDPANLARKNDVADVVVVMDYSYTPAQ